MLQRSKVHHFQARTCVRDKITDVVRTSASVTCHYPGRSSAVGSILICHSPPFYDAVLGVASLLFLPFTHINGNITLFTQNVIQRGVH